MCGNGDPQWWPNLIFISPSPPTFYKFSSIFPQFLSIENWEITQISNYDNQWPNSWECHQTAFAILAMFKIRVENPLFIVYILTQDLSLEWIDQFLTVSDIPPGPTMHQSLDLMQKENWVLPLPGILLWSILDICSTTSGIFTKQIRNVKTVEWLMLNKLQHLPNSITI